MVGFFKSFRGAHDPIHDTLDWLATGARSGKKEKMIERWDSEGASKGRVKARRALKKQERKSANAAKPPYDPHEENRGEPEEEPGQEEWQDENDGQYPENSQEYEEDNHEQQGRRNSSHPSQVGPAGRPPSNLQGKPPSQQGVSPTSSSRRNIVPNDHTVAQKTTVVPGWQNNRIAPIGDNERTYYEGMIPDSKKPFERSLGAPSVRTRNPNPNDDGE